MTKRGTISFVFDDGYTPVFEQVVPLLNKYQLPAVFAVPIESDQLARESKVPITPWGQWLPLKSHGHEIAAHSLTHTNLTTLEDRRLTDELSIPADLLQASTLIYPGGAYNQPVIHRTKNFYKSARTVNKGFAKLPPKNPYTLPTYNFTKNNFSPLKANLLALSAWLTNSWLIETYHLVDDQPSDMLHSVQLKDFSRHLDFVSRLPVNITTIHSQTNQS
jgi:peptidoglycan/xylan/chitin deacetylase (PgdA/CDA1 family)